MRCLPCMFVFLVTFLVLCGEGWAHRVNVFAFVDGDAIQVECSFSRSQRVKNGRLVITDLDTGDLLLEAETDGQGLFRFRPSDEFLATGHGLVIRLNAGEGHQDDWKITPGELRALAPTERHLAEPLAQSPDAPSAAADAVNEEHPKPVRLSDVDLAGLEALVGRVMDEKLSPIKQALARQDERGPGLRDIVGGIGWILGLLGLGAYMKYRR